MIYLAPMNLICKMGAAVTRPHRVVVTSKGANMCKVPNQSGSGAGSRNHNRYFKHKMRTWALGVHQLPITTILLKHTQWLVTMSIYLNHRYANQTCGHGLAGRFCPWFTPCLAVGWCIWAELVVLQQQNRRRFPGRDKSSKRASPWVMFASIGQSKSHLQLQARAGTERMPYPERLPLRVTTVLIFRI